ncbi:MAG TPA: acyltransferase [Polyangiaceae bacterium]
MTLAAPNAAASKAGAPSPANVHIPTLDGLRAISFSLVFLAHAGLGERVPGGFGVTVFFFLSGYLIATLLRLEIERTGGVNFRNFYLRRVLRILPPFYLTLGLAVCLTLAGVLPGQLRLMPTLAQALHFANYWQVWHGVAGQPAGTGVYWSLAVEEHFYLVFPVLYLWLFRSVRPKARAAVILAVCAAVLGWRYYLVDGLGVVADRTYAATDARFDSLLFGCLLATTGNPALDAPKQGAGAIWKWLLLPLGVAALLFSFVYRSEAFRQTLRYTVQGLALIPVFVVGIREPKWGPFPLLNLRWVRFAGTLSYSLYLVHQVVLFGLEYQLRVGSALRGVIALVLSVLLALAMHRYVELPSARLRKRLASDRVVPLPSSGHLVDSGGATADVSGP